MGQDEIYLQVIKEAGESAERKQAASVLKLLKRGKHWVLVTLLLSNVITNETLPIILDRSIGGGWPAVLGSTVLIGITYSYLPRSVHGTNLYSYFRRNCASVRMRSIRPTYRSFYGPFRSRPDVDSGSCRMANC